MSKPSRKKLAAAAALYTADNDFARGEPHIDIAGTTVPVSMRLSARQLAIVKEFARREAVGYQTLIKRWLDDRIRDEYAQLRTTKSSRDVIVALKRNLNTAMKQLLELEREQKKAS